MRLAGMLQPLAHPGSLGCDIGMHGMAAPDQQCKALYVGNLHPGAPAAPLRALQARALIDSRRCPA